MANSLIRGSEPAADAPVPSAQAGAKVPTWGYKEGDAQIFDLDPGEALPAGWVDSPAKVPEPKPSKKKADAE